MTRLDLGSVWRMTTDIVGRHASIFATLAAAFVFLPAVLLSALVPQAGLMRLPVAGQPPPHPGWLFLLIAVAGLIGLVGHFSIGAIAVDPAEGGGRSLGAIINSVLPKIGKGLLAALYLLAAYLVIMLTIILVISVIGAIYTATGSSGRSLPGTPPGMIVAGLIVIIVLPLGLWVTARLVPMLGVLLREPLTAAASIRRAWALSRGSAGAIVGLILLVLLVSIIVTVVLQSLRTALGLQGGVALLLFAVIQSAVSALIAVYYYTATAVIYRQLTE